MSFDAAQIVALRAIAPRLPRGLVAESWRRRPSFAAAKRALAGCGHALRAHPQFIAYSVTDLPAALPMIARRLLRLPVLAWIYETLQQDDNRRVAKEYFLDKLHSDYGDLAEDQLQVAIQWGRHAELFGFDDDTDELFLESPS